MKNARNIYHSDLSGKTLVICPSYILKHKSLYGFLSHIGGRRGCDHMVVGYTTTYAIGAYHHYSCQFKFRSGEMYSLQHYVIQFVSDLRRVGGFLHQ